VVPVRYAYQLGATVDKWRRMCCAAIKAKFEKACEITRFRAERLF
jgi:hypothetical protein